ncbi:MAG: hypothetical protein OSB19_14115 [Opitutaceae bacterium]|nr:hypothetical protein [Opitutaceae bacterium]
MAIAGVLKQRHLCRNGWIAEQQEMGTESSVCRYVGKMHEGKPAEVKTYDILRPLSRQDRALSEPKHMANYPQIPGKPFAPSPWKDPKLISCMMEYHGGRFWN